MLSRRRRQGDRRAAQGRPLASAARPSTTSSSRRRSGRSAPTSASSRCSRTTRAPPRRSCRSTRRTRSGARLPALYEVLLAHAEDDRRQARAARRSSCEVTGQQLQDRAAAFDWARKGLRARAGRARGRSRRSRRRRGPPGSGQASSRCDARLNARARRSREARQEEEEEGRTRDGAPLRALGKLAEVYAREMGRVDEAVATYRGLVEEDENDDVAVRRSTASCARPTDATTCAGCSSSASSARTRRMKLDLLSEWAHARGRGVRRAGARGRALPPHAGGRRRTTAARCARWPGCSARRATPQGAVEVIALDRDQREGAERAAREVELARLLLEPLQADMPTPSLRAKRALELVAQRPERHRGRRAAAADRRDARARGGDPRAGVRRDRNRAAAGRGPRGAHRDHRGARRSARALRPPGRRARAEARRRDARRSTSSRAPPASSRPSLPLWDRLAALAAKTGRAQAFVDAIAARRPAETGATGLPEAVELDLAERAATLYDEKLGDDRPRAPLPRANARAAAGQRAGVSAPQADPHDARAVGRARGALRAGRRGDRRTPARRAELLAEVALVAEEITGDRPKAIALLRADPRDRSAARAGRPRRSTRSTPPSSDGTARAAARAAARAGRRRARSSSTSSCGSGRCSSRSSGTPADALVVPRAASCASARAVARRASSSRRSSTCRSCGRARRSCSRRCTPSARRGAAISCACSRSTSSSRRRRDERRDLLRARRRAARRAAARRRGRPRGLRPLLPLDPDDARARQRMLEIARRIGAHERAAGVLIDGRGRASAPHPARGDPDGRRAASTRTSSSDAARAEAVYREVLELAPDDAAIALPACRALERIYARPARAGSSREILRVEVKLEDDADARRELLRAARRAVRDRARRPARARSRRGARGSRTIPSDDRGARGARSPVREDARAGARSSRSSAPASAGRRQGARRERCMVRIATTLGGQADGRDRGHPRLPRGRRRLRRRRAIARRAGDALRARRPLAGSGRHARGAISPSPRLPATSWPSSRASARCGRRKLGDVDGGASRPTGRRSIIDAGARGRAARALEGMLEDASARREAAAILRPLYEADGEHDEAPQGARDRGGARRVRPRQARHHRAGRVRSPRGRSTTPRARSSTRPAGCARPSPSRSCRSGSSAPSAWPRRREVRGARRAAAVGRAPRSSTATCSSR